jgi:replicative DNA helicase
LAAGAGPQRIDEDLKQIYLEVSEGKEIEGLVPTGIDIVDEITGGLQPGLLTVLGGRPSMGKSAFALNVAMNAALADKKVLYITLEDVRSFTVRRLLARFADIDLQELALNRLGGDRARKCASMIEAVRKLANKPIWIEDGAGLTSVAIRQIAAAHKNLHGLDLVIVDHLGEVADQGESLTAITEAAAKSARDMAKELDIPALLLVQLNRNLENRPDKRPNMADLRQSGAIEQVARAVWFLYRPGYYKAGCEEAPQCNLIVGKATHGKTGMLNLWCNLSRMYFRGWDTMQDGPFTEMKSADEQGYNDPPPSTGRGSGAERVEPVDSQEEFFRSGKKEEY